jgi:hypothetical protein
MEAEMQRKGLDDRITEGSSAFNGVCKRIMEGTTEGGSQLDGLVKLGQRHQ